MNYRDAPTHRHTSECTNANKQMKRSKSKDIPISTLCQLQPGFADLFGEQDKCESHLLPLEVILYYQIPATLIHPSIHPSNHPSPISTSHSALQVAEALRVKQVSGLLNESFCATPTIPPSLMTAMNRGCANELLSITDCVIHK